MWRPHGDRANSTRTMSEEEPKPFGYTFGVSRSVQLAAPPTGSGVVVSTKTGVRIGCYLLVHGVRPHLEAEHGFDVLAGGFYA